jgi:hypothetical protein
MAKAKAAKATKHAKTPKDPGRLVFRILQIYFVVALILVGLDKFFYLLNNWSIYLSPFFLKMSNCHDRSFMGVIGLIEIIVGIGLAIWPRIFSYIVCIFLIGVIINLLMTGCYYDIAVRDIGLLLAAFCLGKLSMRHAKR